MSAVNGKALRVAVFTLILFMIFVGALRPLARGVEHSRWGLSRLVLLSEPAANDDAPPTVPFRTEVHLLAPIVNVLPLAVKMRRIGFAPVPVHRLKLPARNASRSLPSH